jgi:hypothetical protein
MKALVSFILITIFTLGIFLFGAYIGYGIGQKIAYLDIQVNQFKSELSAFPTTTPTDTQDTKTPVLAEVLDNKVNNIDTSQLQRDIIGWRDYVMQLVEKISKILKENIT